MEKRFNETEKYQLVGRFYGGESASDICATTGIARSTLYSWLQAYKTTVTDAGNVVSPAEFVKMKQRLKRSELMVEVLRTVDCTFSSPLKDKLYALEALHGQYDVRILCEALGVSRGTYYNHVLRNKKKNTSYQARRDILSEEIKRIYEENNQIYGSKKITAVLKEQGIITSDKMVSELMQEMNLYSIRSDAKRNYIRANSEKWGKKKDALKMDFSASAPNQVWVSDVTAFKLDNKMYYVCVILDLYSRKIIACKTSQKHSTQLISGTFKIAYAARAPQSDLTFHSDRGSPYVSYSFHRLLQSCGVEQSFSPSGKPHHNAVMEAFFASMKREELYRTEYHSAAEFKRRVGEYVQFYNAKRPHSTLGYKTPDKHEELFYKRNTPKAG